MSARHPYAPPKQAYLAAVAMIAAGLLMVDCAGESDGEFTISGASRYQSCFSAASPIRPEMFAARQRVHSVGLLMQTDFRLPSLSDLVYFEVYQPDVVRSRLGEPIELSDPVELVEGDEDFEEPPIVRGKLFVADTCPELTETFAIRGTVVFDRLGAEDGQVVRGELTDGEVVSVRDQTVVATNITGVWDFEVTQGPPYQTFPNERDEIPPGPAP